MIINQSINQYIIMPPESWPTCTPLGTTYRTRYGGGDHKTQRMAVWS